MAKAKRGIPEGFNLEIAASPAILGDFLDEPPAAPLSPASQMKEDPQPVGAGKLSERKASSPIAVVRTQSSPQLAEVMAREGAVSESRDGTPALVSPRVAELKPPRMELSLNHESKRMVQELLNYVQQMLPQSPAKASEVFQGIISVLYRAKGSLDLSTVPRRGQWGSPTAKAFPFALGQAFAKAIADQYLIENSKRGVG